MVYQDAAASLTPWLVVEELVGERLRAEGASREERHEKVVTALASVNLPASVASTRPSAWRTCTRSIAVTGVRNVRISSRAFTTGIELGS